MWAYSDNSVDSLDNHRDLHPIARPLGPNMVFYVQTVFCVLQVVYVVDSTIEGHIFRSQQFCRMFVPTRKHYATQIFYGDN